LPVGAFLAGAAFTACVYLAPGFDVAYRSVPLRVGTDVLGAVVGVAVAFVLLGRPGDTPLLGDQLVAAAFLISAAANLFFLTVPTAHAYGQTSRFSAWSTSSAVLLEALLLLAATLTFDRRVPVGPGATVTGTLAAVGVVCAAVAVSFALVAHRLPFAIDQTIAPAGSGIRLPAGSGGLALLSLTTAALLGIAAARIWQRGPEGDPLYASLATGLVIAALALVNFAVFPSEYSRWVYAGDILSFASWLVILVGVAAEVALYRRQLVRMAVLEERRRIARDLHDRLAHELAFIALEADGASGPARPGVRLARIGSAAERALQEVRLAIAALTEPLDGSVARGVQRAARDAARLRSGLGVEVVGPDFEASPAEREALLRIAGEATLNAIRHGRATRVRVRLSRAHLRVLRVVDNGTGFDPATPHDGFGIVSMNERAEAAGGELTIRSLRGLGSVVQLALSGRESATRVDR
jgi:signal transduction histidine kinase